MPRFIKLHKENIGLAPEDIVFRGVRKSDDVQFNLFQYDIDNLDEQQFIIFEELPEKLLPGRIQWINIDGLHDVESMEKLAVIFGLESHIMAIVLDTYARPKILEFDDGLLISLKMLRYDEPSAEVISENLVLILKDGLLISFQERVGDVFDPVRDRLRKNKRGIRQYGADFLAFSFIDIVIDNYIYLISRIGDKIENLDDELDLNATTKQLDAINDLKGEINFLRKAIKPCRELILNFIKIESDLFSDKLDKHLPELQNNIELANESADSYREMLSDQLNIFHTNVSYKLNDIIKFLTVFSVIFIPVTFITGVYGTNFIELPETHYKYGYFIMWGVIILIVGLMIFWFKRKKWM